MTSDQMSALQRMFALIIVLAFGGNVPQEAFASLSEQNIRPISIYDLATIREIDSFSVSPTGKHIIANVRTPDIEQNRYNIEWVLVSTSNSFPPKAVANGGDVWLPVNPVTGIRSGFISAPQHAWSPKGRYVVYLHKTEYGQQLWLVDVIRFKSKQLTHEEADVVSFNWSADGNTIEYYIAGETRTDRIVQREDEYRRGLLYSENRFVYTPTFSDHFPTDLRPRYYDIKESKSVEAEKFTRQHDRVGSDIDLPPTTADVKLLTVSSDGAKSAWVERDLVPDNGGSYPLRRLTAITDPKKPVTCKHSECASQNFTKLWWSADNTELFFGIGLGLTHHEKRIFSWNPYTDTLRKVYQSFDYLDQCELHGNFFFCLYENPTQPNTIVSLDTKSGRLQTLFDPNPEFKNIQFGEVRRLTWTTKKWGNKESGYLILPIGYDKHQSYPIAIESYWFTGFLQGIHQEFPIHALAANGIAVLCVNRPAGVSRELSKRKVVDSDEMQRIAYEGNRYRIEPLYVLEAGLDYVASQHSIDMDHVGLFGLSDGAQTVHFALTHSNRSYAAASVSSGGQTPSMFFLTSDKHRSRLISTGFGYPYGEAWGIWQRSSPSIHAERVRTPLLVQVADEEFYFSRETIESLKHFEKPIETHVFPDEHHIKWQPIHKFFALERNLQWFQFWLQNVEVDQPVDTEQYGRWRRLRALRDQNEQSPN